MNAGTQFEKAPYTRLEPVIRVIHQTRERGLPDPVNSGTLERLGINPHQAYQTIQALVFLGLIDGEGHVADTFERLRRASTQEYPAVLAEIIQTAYRPVFAIVDPGQGSLIAINDAFRHYKPDGQRERMVTLFLGLCREAGLRAEDQPRKRARDTVRVYQQPKHKPEQAAKKSKPEQQAVSTEESADVDEEAVRKNPETIPDYRMSASTDYSLVVALIRQLPRDGRWTKMKRDLWLQAMAATVDLLIEVAPET